MKMLRCLTAVLFALFSLTSFGGGSEPSSDPVLELNALNVRFFPKQIDNTGWMRFDNPSAEPHYLSLNNAAGDCVWQGRDGGSGTIQLNLSHLPAGAYTWQLTSIGGAEYNGDLELH